ncbi:MAG: SDR family NAD(P)-dependent oxidoreductase, partial [Gluconobacter cerinus]
MYMEKLRLDGRVAVVTGGAQNIGLACVTALAEAGARVIIADLDETLAAQSAEDLRKQDLNVDSIRMDVTSTESVQSAIKTLHEKEGHLDILVACAGICISEVKAEDMTDGQWLKQVDINLNGMFRCCQAVGRIMIEQKKGTIVAIG